MKRVFLIIFVAILLLIPPNVVAQDVNATFAWEQSDYDATNYWKLYWGLTSGGPYAVDLLKITKELAQESQTAPVVINYPADAKTKYYYVLVAFKDTTHFSGNSNEVFFEADFIEAPGTPVQLRIIITPAP